MSYYAGLDISSKHTSIAIVNYKGTIVFETRCETNAEDIAFHLRSTGFALEKIGLESGNLSFWLMDELKEQGLEVICIDSREMSVLLKLKINKTDRNDARKIADAMRCNQYKEVHHKSKESVEIVLLMGARRSLVSIRTQLKNTIRGLLKSSGLRFGQVSHKLFPNVVRESIKTYEQSVEIGIEGLLKTYEETCSNIENIETEINHHEETDPVVKLLQTIPGVGPITAMTYKAFIDDPFRFKNSRDVGAYLGITPTQFSSGESIKQGRISKRGSSELRTLLVECGNVILTRTTSWTKLKAWGLKIMKKNGLKKASTAVARKLSIIMLIMWKTGKSFVWGEEKNDANPCVDEQKNAPMKPKIKIKKRVKEESSATKKTA